MILRVFSRGRLCFELQFLYFAPRIARRIAFLSNGVVFRAAGWAFVVAEVRYEKRKDNACSLSKRRDYRTPDSFFFPFTRAQFLMRF